MQQFVQAIEKLVVKAFDYLISNYFLREFIMNRLQFHHKEVYFSK